MPFSATQKYLNVYKFVSKTQLVQRILIFCFIPFLYVVFSIEKKEIHIHTFNYLLNKNTKLF